MKNILILIVIIKYSFAFGQRGFYTARCPAIKSYDSACATIPIGKVNYALNRFVIREIQRGNFQLYDKFWVYAQDQSANAVLSIVKTSTGGGATSLVNSPTFTAYQGYTGNGTSSYLNTNFNAAANGIQYTQNSACYGAYFRTQEGSSNKVQIGSYTNPSNISIGLHFTTTGKIYDCNTFASNVNVSDTVTIGRFVNARTSSTVESLWKNGVSYGNVSTNSVAPPNLVNTVLAWNILGVPARFSTNTVSETFFGNGAIDINGLNIDAEEMRSKIGY
jgi:hypothetical protein